MNTVADHETMQIRTIGTYHTTKHFVELLYREYETKQSTIRYTPRLLPHPGEGTTHITIHFFKKYPRHAIADES